MKTHIQETASQEAYALHRLTDIGQDAAQNFIDANPNVNFKKLMSDLVRDKAYRYTVRDIVKGSADKVHVKQFTKKYGALAEATAEPFTLDSYSASDSDAITDFLNTNKIAFKKLGSKITIDTKRSEMSAASIKNKLKSLAKFDELNEAKSNPEIDKLLKIMDTKKGGPEYKKALMSLIAMAEKKSGKTVNTKKEALLALDYIEPSIKEVNLNQSKLSSSEYQQAKKLKNFKASDWKWNADEHLYVKVNEGMAESNKSVTELIESIVTQTILEMYQPVDYDPNIHKTLEVGAVDYELDPTGKILYAYMPFKEEEQNAVTVPFKKEYIESFADVEINSQEDLDTMDQSRLDMFVKNVFKRADKDQILKKVLAINK